MVSIDALIEAAESINSCNYSFRIERGHGGFNAILIFPDVAFRESGKSPTEAIESLASRIFAWANDRAECVATEASAKLAEADKAARLAIQFKRVVDGFAQGASE